MIDVARDARWGRVGEGYGEDPYTNAVFGVDMDMVDNIYRENLSLLIAEKKITSDKIDEAVRHILRIKFSLGLFDKPYSIIEDENARYLQPESKSIARQLAAESMVLLKNSNSTLPIPSTVKKIALIGPMAKDKSNLLGSWSFNGKTEDVESIFEGLEKESGKTPGINYAKGCDFEGNYESGFTEAVAMAQKSDFIIVCLGEKNEWSGENASRSTIALPVIQEKLVQELKKTKKPIVLVLSNGRPLELVRLELAETSRLW